MPCCRKVRSENANICAQSGRELLARQRFDRDAGLGDAAALASQLLALVGPEAREVLVEVRVAAVVPDETGNPRGAGNPPASSASWSSVSREIDVDARTAGARARRAIRAGRARGRMPSQLVACASNRVRSRACRGSRRGAWGNSRARARCKPAPSASRRRTRPRNAASRYSGTAPASRPAASRRRACRGIQPVSPPTQPVASSAARNACLTNG